MEIVKDKDLLDLSKRIAAEWEFVARYLTIEEAQINIFKKDYDHTRERIYQMLLFWKKEKGNGATYRVLTQALRQSERNDLADDLSLRQGNMGIIL
ncbi:Receptor-interacting serine/threonine-protein kinase 1 [Holothuria leucospilota]|uniref:Receptor-interacting serine/threonine-protein kinase 1 n=1 Tax=Holothuria leucospilota TaxID=206669 RepID=A0A9Q0YDD0_HOLLE|nr:Receptor-interacting serine/threonine-protein kinase 1 [Holothuria leucospilota]